MHHTVLYNLTPTFKAGQSNTNTELCTECFPTNAWLLAEKHSYKEKSNFNVYEYHIEHIIGWR